MKILVYGATGYTGKLVSQALAARAVPQIVAGRRADVVAPWAKVVGAEARVFSLDAPDLRDVSAVLNCAGPFAATAMPLVRAALSQGVHYLDLAGEVAEHEALRVHSEEAESRGVMLMPGVGFGVVPTECAAALAFAKLPSARKLIIAYETVGGASRGTLETVLGGLAENGVVRRGGILVPSSPCERELTLDLGGGPTRVATNPFRADLVSAFVATGVLDIETYATFPWPLRVLMRSGARKWGSVRSLIDRLVARAPEGPTPTERARGSTRILVVAEDAEHRVEVRVRGPEAYAFTARCASTIAARIAEAKPGFRTPSQVFGPELLASLLTGENEGVKVSS